MLPPEITAPQPIAGEPHLAPKKPIYCLSIAEKPYLAVAKPPCQGSELIPPGVPIQPFIGAVFLCPMIKL
jgi:hypothetical protein